MDGDGTMEEAHGGETDGVYDQMPTDPAGAAAEDMMGLIAPDGAFTLGEDSEGTGDFLGRRLASATWSHALILAGVACELCISE